jgi:hypothetical protein
MAPAHQKWLKPPFAPHRDTGDDRRASRRALESTVMLRGMGMDVSSVMRDADASSP